MPLVREIPRGVHMDDRRPYSRGIQHRPRSRAPVQIRRRQRARMVCARAPVSRVTGIISSRRCREAGVTANYRGAISSFTHR